MTWSASDDSLALDTFSKTLTNIPTVRHPANGSAVESFICVSTSDAPTADPRIRLHAGMPHVTKRSGHRGVPPPVTFLWCGTSLPWHTRGPPAAAAAARSRMQRYSFAFSRHPRWPPTLAPCDGSGRPRHPCLHRGVSASFPCPTHGPSSPLDQQRHPDHPDGSSSSRLPWHPRLPSPASASLWQTHLHRRFHHRLPGHPDLPTAGSKPVPASENPL